MQVKLKVTHIIMIFGALIAPKGVDFENYRPFIMNPTISLEVTFECKIKVALIFIGHSNPAQCVLVSMRRFFQS